MVKRAQPGPRADPYKTPSSAGVMAQSFTGRTFRRYAQLLLRSPLIKPRVNTFLAAVNRPAYTRCPQPTFPDGLSVGVRQDSEFGLPTLPFSRALLQSVSL
ncbi:hypothetical protein XENOCAPTIV_029466 [Xenoophorus captivus]|uniref:Uncharacterized protein n=1 Tax=Xenoophorus captivus TaxID=1517983 RepID=A0ABV0RL34_9TELE